MTPAELHGWWMVYVGPKTLVGCPTRVGDRTALDPVFEWLVQLGKASAVIPTPVGPRKVERPVMQIEAIPVSFIRGIRRVYLPDQVAFVRIDELGPVERELIAKKITELHDAIATADKVDEQSKLVQP